MTDNKKEEYTGLAKFLNDNKKGLVGILAFFGMFYLFNEFTEGTSWEGHFVEFIFVFIGIVVFIFYTSKKKWKNW